MTKLTEEKIKFLLDLEKRISPAPWKFDCGNLEVEIYDFRNHVCRLDGYGSEEPEFERVGHPFDDGDFIEEMRNAAPALLNEVLDLRSIVTDLKLAICRYEEILDEMPDRIE